MSTPSRVVSEAILGRPNALNAVASILGQAKIDSLELLGRDKSHHKSNSGEFRNPWPSAIQNPSMFKFFSGFVSDWQKVDMNPPEGLPKVMEPNWEAIYRPLPAQRQQVTWLGHATFLVQIDGFNILTDPIFTHRCSPMSWIGPSRFTPLPPSVLLPENLPQIHLVIISHNHYDHTSTDTISFLHSEERLKALRNALPHRQSPETLVVPDNSRIANAADASGTKLVDLQDLAPHWLVPLGIRSLIEGQGVASNRVHELDWWGTQGFRLQDLKLAGNGEQSGVEKPTMPEITAVCLPCQHFSGRTLMDRNETLWASWALIGPTQRMYFGGDTGIRNVPKEAVPCCSTGTPADFGIAAEEAEREELRVANLPICPEFERIGNELGPFDLSLIPIGAYSPRWMMSNVHLNPLDSVLVHRLVKSKKSIGMHWGTFCLTDEPIWEPPRRLAREVAREHLEANDFIVMQHGETVVV